MDFSKRDLGDIVRLEKNKNYERIKSENNNENQYLKEFHKAMVETSYCRLGIVFSEECEIEDMLLLSI